jgi:hypothetical protein
MTRSTNIPNVIQFRNRVAFTTPVCSCTRREISRRAQTVENNNRLQINRRHVPTNRPVVDVASRSAVQRVRLVIEKIRIRDVLEEQRVL